MRLVEVYTSTQGEGPNVGRPTQFVRFGGCNLRCPGWPCDTPFAIDPAKYRDTWVKMDPGEVFSRLATWPKHVCLTGGEPLLQPTHEMKELCDELMNWGYTYEMFTNGTFALPVLGATYVMDWKLPGSGEDPMNPERLANLKRLKRNDAIKFVIKDEKDFNLARYMYAEHVPKGRNAPLVYAGVVWGELGEKDLVAWILESQLPWRLNVQVHNHVWPVNERKR